MRRRRKKVIRSLCLILLMEDLLSCIRCGLMSREFFSLGRNMKFGIVVMIIGFW